MGASLAQLRELAAAWREEGREVHEFPAGIAVEFDDGSDALFLMPGEPLSSVPLGEEINPEELRAIFMRVNESRKRVIDVLRRHSMRNKVHIQRRRSGRWSTMSSFGVSSEIEVGQRLTKMLVDGSTPAQAIPALFEGAWGKKPSEQEIQEYLSAREPIEDLPWPEKTPTLKIPDSPLAILRMSRAWNALTENEGVWDGLWKLVGPLSPEAKALRKMAALLRDTHASKEISSGALLIDFTDGLADFHIQPKGQMLKDLVIQRGAAGAGEHLAGEYRRLDAARTKVIGAVKSALAERGYAMHREGNATLHFGRQYRELTVDAGDALTAALRDKPIMDAARELLAGHPELADAAARRCDGVPGPAKAIQERELPLAPPEPLKLPELEMLDLNAIDALAEGILKEFREDKEFLWARYRSMYYQPDVDRWATDEMWRAAAEKRLREEDRDSTARLILCELGDTELETRWMEEMKDWEAHHEADAGQVLAIWRNRKRYPEVARKWFFPDYIGDTYTKNTASEGDAVAIRRLCIDYDAAEEEIPQWLEPEAAWFLRPEQLKQIHESLRHWAHTSWRWGSFVEHPPLQIAAAMGWADVAELLEANPYVARGLLDEQEMPIIHGGDLLLAWSWLRPSEYLTRLIGHTFAKASPEVVRKRTMKLVGSQDFAQQHPEVVQGIQTSQLYGLQWPLAIAWTRCRLWMERGR